jgi:hypothetical protein
LKEKKNKIKLLQRLLNYLVYLLGFIALIIVVLFGFSQTSTFREFLKETIVKEANSTINGSLFIDNIDGTIFTSLFLREVSLVSNDNIPFYAKRIAIKTSPLQLLLGKIHFRQIELQDVSVELLQNEDLTWNYSNLLKTDTAQIEIKNDSSDTAKKSEEPFPYSFEVNELLLKNIRLVRKTFENINNTEISNQMDFENLIIDSLYLDSGLYADIANNEYELDIVNLSFMPNVEKFALNELKGEFNITPEFAEINDLVLLTNNTELKLSARLDSLNLFGDVVLENFKDYPLQLELESDAFFFDDLSSFIADVDFLKGIPSIYLSADGTFGDISVNKLNVAYNKTNLNAHGKVQKLNTPGELYLDIFIEKSIADYKTVNELIPSLNIPNYKNLFITDVNIHYWGEPTKFNTDLTATLPLGKIACSGFMNVGAEPMEYDLEFSTKNANVKEIIGIDSRINSSGFIKGKGLDPTTLQADLKVLVTDSEFNNYSIDTIDVKSIGNIRDIKLEMTGIINGSSSNLSANLDFTNEDNPLYSLYGDVKNLDLATFLFDSTYNSNLNFTFNISGENLEIDSMTSSFYVELDSSEYNNKFIDETSLELKLSLEDGVRGFSLISDFLDFNINGEFSLETAIDLLSYEAQTISNTFIDRAQDLNPVFLLTDTTNTVFEDPVLPDIIKSNLEFSFDYEFKDFEIISIITGAEKLDIEGSGEGIVKNNSNDFSIFVNTFIDYFIFIDSLNILYISELEADFNFNRDNQSLSFDNLLGLLSITGKRVYSGVDINNILADFTFNQDKLIYNISSDIEDEVYAEFEGNIEVKERFREINVDKVTLEYEDIVWENNNKWKILVSNNQFKIDNFLLTNQNSSLNFSGSIYNDNTHNYEVSIQNISSKIIGEYLLDFDDELFDVNVNMTLNSFGNLSSPQMNLIIDVNDIKLANSEFGYLQCYLNYENEIINTDIKLLNSDRESASPLFTINGTVPYDLSYQSRENRIIKNKEINLEIFSDNFDVSSLGNTVPYITNQKGKLTSDIKVSGNFENINVNGILKLDESNFRFDDNNLDYSAKAKILFEDNNIFIDSLRLANSGGSNYNGTLNGNGKINFKGLELKEINLDIYGDLAVLGQRTQAVSPRFYGDLLIGSDGNLNFSYSNKKSELTGTVLLKKTNLTYVTGQEVATQYDQDFIYVYLIDSTKIDKESEKFKRLVLKNIKQAEEESDEVKPASSLINYDLNIKIEDRAQIVFILSQAFNQKLFVDAAGSIKYEKVGDATRAQGQFNLLDGSRLEFFKSFEATGYLRFESDLINPYIDIVGTYTSYYSDPINDDVAIEMKINSLLDNLGANLSNNEDIFSIYVGSQNIENKVPSTQYDASDAVTFILLNRFRDDSNLSQEEKQDAASQLGASTASSILSPVLTDFANNVIGDFINDVRLSQTKGQYNFRVAGRVSNVRYIIEGPQEVFSNLKNANFRFEYSIDPNIVIKLERKDPVIQSTTSSEDKINELGLKYKIEF